MSDPENFLTRWSRRKRAATDEPDRAERDAQEERAPDTSPVEPAASGAPPSPSTTTEPSAKDASFDLSTLPPIESITADTDIRAFLAPGVPAELRLAALRRAWVADPKVRDFVGLNDYDFDFHTPGAIPGFGSLEMTDELRQEVARIVGAWQPESNTNQTQPRDEPPVAAKSGEDSTQPASPTPEIGEVPSSKGARTIAASDDGPEIPAHYQDELIEDKATQHRNVESAASQQEQSQPQNVQTLARRGHGGALPQ